MAYSYWMSFVGNVLGAPGQMAGWVYETNSSVAKPGIWMLGWDSVKPYPTDARVSAATLRHYLTHKPAFFDAGSGYTWPWVDPVGATKLYVLPAKARYDAGTPFTQP